MGLFRGLVVAARSLTSTVVRRVGRGTRVGRRVTYGWTPPAQTVYGGRTPIAVTKGYIHQTAEAQHGGPDIEGVYAQPTQGWNSMIWRWADTMRVDAIEHVSGPGGSPAYEMELSPSDGSSPGTVAGNPRAELYSVDPAEKRRERPGTGGQFFADGDEYWATFAVYLPVGFPVQGWSTLFQRKLDDRFLASCINETGDPMTCKKFFMTWLTLNVHPPQGTSTKAQVDVASPGWPAWPKVAGGAPDWIKVCDVEDIAGKWAQFVVHEILSTGNGGAADVELVVDGKSVIKVQVAPFPHTPSRPTLPSVTYKGDVYGHVQFGYYRTNNGSPPTASVLYSPLMIKRGSTRGVVPRLP